MMGFSPSFLRFLFIVAAGDVEEVESGAFPFAPAIMGGEASGWDDDGGGVGSWDAICGYVFRSFPCGCRRGCEGEGVGFDVGFCDW